MPGTGVSGLEVGTDHIAFDVDTPGSPVLVKASYFPNWRVEGADGPYRVAPNLMVVVPTDEHVELTYGREPVEWIAYALTAVGIGLADRPRPCCPPVRGRKDDDERRRPRRPAHLAP